MVLRSIVALAHELGKKVVAEGVEAEDDVGFLRSIGCEYAQGFYYGEPMAERDLLQLLKVVRRAERRLRRSSLFRQRVKTRDETEPAVAAAAPAAVEAHKRTAPAAGTAAGPPPPNGRCPARPASPSDRRSQAAPQTVPALAASPACRPHGPPPLPRTGPPTAAACR